MMRRFGFKVIGAGALLVIGGLSAAVSSCSEDYDSGPIITPSAVVETWSPPPPVGVEPAPSPTTIAPQRLVAPSRRAATHRATTRPAPKKAKTTKPKVAKTTPPAARTVTPGAFCSPAGAHGVSKKGITYTCKGPGQVRWRR